MLKIENPGNISEYSVNPSSPSKEDAWVLKSTSISSVVGGGALKSFFGLALPLISVGTHTTGSTTYYLSYQTLEGTTITIPFNTAFINSGTAQGQLCFWDNSLQKWVHTETSELVWDDTNKRVGVGVANPGVKLHIKDTSANDTDLNTTFVIESNANNIWLLYSFSATAYCGNVQRGRRALGTYDSPSNLGNNDYAFIRWSGEGYVGGAYQESVLMSFYGNSDGTNIDGTVLFYTKEKADPTLIERMVIIPNGNMGLGNSSPSEKLQVSGNIFLTTDSNKFLLGTGKDMSIDYDGTIGNIKTDLVAASDLHIDCGTDKTIVLDESVYNDANVGGLVLRSGGTAPGVVQWLDNDGDATGLYTIGFADGEQGSGSIEIPHDYKEGTNLTFHVHYGINDAPTGTDKIRFDLIYNVQRDGTTFVDATTIDSTDITVDTQYKTDKINFTAITGTSFKIGDQFNFTLKRTTAVGDAFTGEVLIQTLGFHYECDTLGSRQIGTK